MALKIEVLKTKFIFEGKDLSPPQGINNPETVREMYSGLYPSLLNATVSRENKVNEVVFTFTKSAGTKG